MCRLGMTSHTSDEFVSVSLLDEMDQLPTYDPRVSKKAASRLKYARKAVHLVPVIVIACFIILWFFSHPAVDLANKGTSIAAANEVSKLDNYAYWNNDINLLELGREVQRVGRRAMADEFERSSEKF